MLFSVPVLFHQKHRALKQDFSEYYFLWLQQEKDQNKQEQNYFVRKKTKESPSQNSSNRYLNAENVDILLVTQFPVLKLWWIVL